MSVANPKAKRSVKTIVTPSEHRVAGGYGAIAAVQSPKETLTRLVMANLLWEDQAYSDGKLISDEIANMVPLCSASEVYDIALKARVEQKLRNTPLYLAVLMAKHHKSMVADLLPKIISRADMITDFLGIYKRVNGSLKPLGSQVKKGLRKAFENFDEYQFAKYDRDGEIKLRDALCLVRPKPSQGKEELYKRIRERTLKTPDTWEVALSTGKDKKETWTRLIQTKKIGGLAMLRNISNMMKAGVDKTIISEGIRNVNGTMLLPMNYITSAGMNPEFEREIESVMIDSYSKLTKLPGKTLFVVDSSGSMNARISSKSTASRFDVACAMAMLAAHRCDNFELVVTAGDDFGGTHSTEHIKYPGVGFNVIEAIKNAAKNVGGGGIFTRQCLEWCKKNVSGEFDRIIIFSDSQDCDSTNNKPKPYGTYNYICDVSAHKHAINYKGVWTAEISGWSEHFMTYIAAFENLGNNFEVEADQ